MDRHVLCVSVSTRALKGDKLKMSTDLISEHKLKFLGGHAPSVGMSREPAVFPRGGAYRLEIISAPFRGVFIISNR